MNRDVLQWVKRVKGTTALEKFILYILATDAGNPVPGKKPNAFTSIGTMTEVILSDRRHIEHSIDSIVDKGFVSKEHRTYGRKHTSNNYFFHTDRFFPIDKVATKTSPERNWNKRGERVLTEIVHCMATLYPGDVTFIEGLKMAGMDSTKKQPVLWLVIESRSHMNTYYTRWKEIEAWLKKYIGSVPVLNRKTGNPVPGQSQLLFEIQFIKLYKDFEL